jgi:hypothetical protein
VPHALPRRHAFVAAGAGVGGAVLTTRATRIFATLAARSAGESLAQGFARGLRTVTGLGGAAATRCFVDDLRTFVARFGFNPRPASILRTRAARSAGV